jgi:hypothetical protein
MKQKHLHRYSSGNLSNLSLLKRIASYAGKGSLLLFLLLSTVAMNAQTTDKFTVTFPSITGVSFDVAGGTKISDKDAINPIYQGTIGENLTFKVTTSTTDAAIIYANWNWVDGCWRPAYVVTANDVILYADSKGIYTINNIVGGKHEIEIKVKTNEYYPAPVIKRRVFLPGGFDTNPGPGAYYVESGQDFEFQIPATEGQEPSVSVGDYKNVGKITCDLDGNVYKVRIRTVRENIDIKIESTTRKGTGNATIAATSKVWASNGAIYVTQAANGDARIYNLTGALVKIVPYISGETVTAQLSKGLYLVVADGKTWKVVVN